MVHFTCDLCGKELNGSGDGRYVVKIEAYPGFDPTEIKEDDLDDDPMEAVAQMIQRDEALVSEDLATPLQKGFRFDLCSLLPQQIRQRPTRERCDSFIRFQQELIDARLASFNRRPRPHPGRGSRLASRRFIRMRGWPLGSPALVHVIRNERLFDICQAH